jgi:heme-degrading monooxygenase HmoA
MILEAANLNTRPGESAEFERAFAEAQAISAARPGYTSVRARRSQYNRLISLTGS